MKLTEVVFTAFFTILSHTLIAQENFKAANIELANGEKKEGLIHVENWKMNPKRVLFKENIRAQEQVFTVSMLKSFRIQNGDFYVSAIVSKDILPVKYAELKPQGTVMSVVDTVFLRELVAGPPLSLYELIDEKTHFYFGKPDGKIEELEYRIYLKNAERLNRQVVNDDVIYQHHFRNQLRVYALNDVSMLYKIDNADYNAKTLTRIVRELNRIAGQPHTNHEVGVKKIFFAAGASSNKIGFSGDKSPQLLDKLEGETKAGSVLKINGDFYGTKKTRNVFLRTEVNYSFFKYRGRIKTVSTTGALYNLTIKNFGASASVAYKFLRSTDFNFYVGAGPGINFSSYPRNTISTSNPNLPDDKMEVNKVWYDLFSRAGIFYKVMNLEVSYRLAGDPFSNRNVKSRYSTLAITFGLGFKL